MSKIPYNKILKEESKEKYISIVHKFCYIYIIFGRMIFRIAWYVF